MYIFTASKYAKVNIDDVKYNNVDKLHGIIFLLKEGYFKVIVII
jgi:hypothetical protein